MNRYLANVIHEWSARRRIKTEGAVHTISGCMRPKAASCIWAGLAQPTARRANEMMLWIESRLIIFHDGLMSAASGLDETMRLIAGSIVWEEIYVTHGLPRTNRPVCVNCLNIFTASAVQSTRWSIVLNGIPNARWI